MPEQFLPYPAPPGTLCLRHSAFSAVNGKWDTCTFPQGLSKTCSQGSQLESKLSSQQILAAKLILTYTVNSNLIYWWTGLCQNFSILSWFLSWGFLILPYQENSADQPGKLKWNSDNAAYQTTSHYCSTSTWLSFFLVLTHFSYCYRNDTSELWNLGKDFMQVKSALLFNHQKTETNKIQMVRTMRGK